ncbi:MAG TPA: hypothetical protein VK783_01380 [Bacteroidia bacterium]|nr:hypothetical protein [Bacteroidia bacterium]
MILLKKAYCNLLLVILLLVTQDALSQSKSDTYLFHFLPFKNEKPAGPPHARRVKVRLDFGLVHQYVVTDPHYTSSLENDGAPYTIGLKLDIPVLQNANILVGADFVSENFDFYSFYFAPGYSVLYTGHEPYDHAIEMDELQIPIEYKINFNPETRSAKEFFATIGWVYRDVFYNNSLITVGNTDGFVWEGQNDINSVFKLFGPTGSGMFEASLGYQHNGLRTGNGWFFEIEYKYGLSPLTYLGNEAIGSNYIQFTLNTLSFKLGIKI